VGIASDARIVDLHDPAAPVVLLSSLQDPSQWGNLIVRAQATPEELTKSIGQAIESLGHEYPLRTKTI
jgi:hypothetical protein